VGHRHQGPAPRRPARGARGRGPHGAHGTPRAVQRGPARVPVRGVRDGEGQALITDVEGLRVGSWTDPVGATGCTVVLCPPGTDEGYAACRHAGTDVPQGNVGAGTGATVGPDRLKGGLGTASAAEGDAVVGALVAVNAFGMVLDEQGEPFLPPLEGEPAPPFP